VACTHPFGIDPIRDAEGEIIGGRCPSCGMVAYKGDSFWTTVKRALRFIVGVA
jgi:uncharacterized C2H2 Zn-finger protein